MTQDTDAADIAWMRRLAEDGAQAPFGGGRYLLAAGLIYGAASLVHWAGVTGALPIAPQQIGWVWLGATVLFLALLVVLRRGCVGVKTAANRAAGAAWSVVGWGIFALLTSISLVAWRMGFPAADGALALIPSAVLIFYGLAWGVSAAMSRSRFLTGLAVASLIAAPLMALLAGSSALYLAYAAALILLAAVPGWMLMRKAAAAR